MKISGVDDIGVIVRQRRKALTLSQAELASRSGVTRQWLTRFERGNAEVALSKVFAVLRELDLMMRIDAREDSVVPRQYDIPRVVVPRMTFEPVALARVRDRLRAIPLDEASCDE
ncbi:helix-turn-helix domain-containing protein [Galbitalea soli]|uniref:Helix-turn-helix domain-containing protein n=1 Tax=Galbitalea soli TaxID=1268042 RepID=A0A7C9PMC0_9MICO|nr:helix-turn-helix domain-containing protein [Galbitalea soli]NEM90812.1 helix-turn-helix domain-containing protein [Galbitalea soli]NYJ31530.1 transcriptional regulator with XRE-family HTH domain [Galbitalea soli]